MTAARQLAALEGSLQPLEVVLGVITEAQRHPGLDAYARAVAQAPIEAAPMSRIAAETATSARAAARGQGREAIDMAAHRAVGDAIFRYMLFLRINTAALEMAELEGLRASAGAFWMGCLLGGPRQEDLEPDEWAAHQEEQRRAWQTWRGVIASLYLLLMVEDEAREQLEAKFLGGHEALLADVNETWDGFADEVERLWTMSEALVPISGEEAAAVAAAGTEVFDQRVAERVRRIADDARVATFERLGDLPRAVVIMERRLSAP